MNKKDLRANHIHSFWITNISKKNVSLADLLLTIHAGRTMNLLDERHFSYTLDQLQVSKESGSLYLKRDKIKIVDKPPKNIIKPGLYVSKEPRYIPSRSNVRVEEKVFDELLSADSDQFASDEKFADEATQSESDWMQKKKQ